jgi:hypothetical protein
MLHLSNEIPLSIFFLNQADREYSRIASTSGDTDWGRVIVDEVGFM